MFDPSERITADIPEGCDFSDDSFWNDTPPPEPNPLAQKMEASRVDLITDVQPQPVYISIYGSTFASGGDFSLLVGKPKSRKTFSISAFLAAVVQNSAVMGGIEGSLPANQKGALYIDTEQGAWHSQRAARRVLRLAGLAHPLNFNAYNLRKYNAAERLALIEYILYNTPSLGFVVIDGVRDLVTSINDEEQASMISSKLLKWTEELNIHILCVLHQNKGDKNPRGHLGTELQNKAQSVLSITIDAQNKGVSIVEAEYCRDKDFEPFAFEIDETGLPTLVENWSPSQGKSERRPSIMPGDILPSMHGQILDKVFLQNKQLNYGALVNQIKLILDDLGTKVGTNKVKEFVQWYQSNDMITKTGTEGTSKAYYIQCINPV